MLAQIEIESSMTNFPFLEDEVTFLTYKNLKKEKYSDYSVNYPFNLIKENALILDLISKLCEQDLISLQEKILILSSCTTNIQAENLYDIEYDSYNNIEMEGKEKKNIEDKRKKYTHYHDIEDQPNFDYIKVYEIAQRIGFPTKFEL